ncbi:MAG: hypothetical protein QNI90_18880, partial [Dinoroseobacter sp.]|nr:hypothetical protein [Dinoroseobacter sp.]
KPRFRFAFSFGATSLDDNDVRAPGSTGSALDLETFDAFSNPTTSSAASFQYFLSDKHEFYAVLNPLEVRDEGTFETPVRFDGAVYPADTLTEMDYVMNEIRAGYLYNLTPDRRWDLQVGGGLSLQNTFVRLVSESIDREVESYDLAPYLAFHTSYQLTDSLYVDLGVEGTSIGDIEFADAVAALRYQISPKWDIGGGVQYYSRDLDTSGLENKYRATSAFFTVGHSF